MANRRVTIANQSTSMSDQSEESHVAGRMKLILNYSTRDQLINCLIQLSTMLESNEPIPENVKSETYKKIEQSIGLLTKLLPYKPIASADHSATFEERIASQLTIELPSEVQLRLMNHLLDNRNTLIFYDQITDQTKRNLISENKRMIVRLIDVPPEEPMADAARSASEDENTGGPPPKRPRAFSAEVSSSNEFDLKEQFSRLEGRVLSSMNELRSELRSELSLQIKSMDVTRDEASFKFELVGVSKFFEAHDNRRDSDRFWCRSLQWFLSTECNWIGESKSLALSLCCANDDSNAWSCEVHYDLILFSKLPGKSLVRQVSHIFKRKSGWGLLSFLSYNELTDESNGYIADDTITLGVEMKAGPVVRG